MIAARPFQDLTRGLGRNAFDLPVAALAALAAAFLAFAMPAVLLERLVVATGLPHLLAAAEPPLGFKARLMLGAAGAAIAFGLAYAPLRLLDRGKRPEARREPEPDAEAGPRLRRRDLHPDAPACRPISAARDFGEPGRLPPERGEPRQLGSLPHETERQELPPQSQEPPEEPYVDEAPPPEFQPQELPLAAEEGTPAWLAGPTETPEADEVPAWLVEAEEAMGSPERTAQPSSADSEPEAIVPEPDFVAPEPAYVASAPAYEAPAPRPETSAPAPTAPTSDAQERPVEAQPLPASEANLSDLMRRLEQGLARRRRDRHAFSAAPHRHAPTPQVFLEADDDRLQNAIESLQRFAARGD